MKRFMFIAAGVLPKRTASHEWVDLKYLENGGHLLSDSIRVPVEKLLCVFMSGSLLITCSSEDLTKQIRC